MSPMEIKYQGAHDPYASLPVLIDQCLEMYLELRRADRVDTKH